MATLFAPKTPKLTKQPVAPAPDDDEIRKATRRRAEQARQASGVKANVYTAGSRETLG